MYKFKKDEEIFIFQYPVGKKKFLFKTKVAEQRISSGFSFIYNYFGKIIPIKNSNIFKHGNLDDKYFWNKNLLI